MHPTTWRHRIRRFVTLGPSRLALGLAILFVLVSLALPFWSLAQFAGTSQEVNSFAWTTFTRDRYEGGAWTETLTRPYSSPQNAYSHVAGVAGNAYLLEVVFLVILVAILALFELEYSRQMPTVSLLIVTLIVLAGALFALFYPLVAIPGAATSDVGTFTVGGFWGTAPAGGTAWTWGPGLGWWLLLIGVILGLVGAVLPYLKSLRAMAPPTPVPMQPSS